ncbi:MAG TPA: DUF305 domain-containing protein [Micropruina sp.]|nr:DUF305 domain-containing protein [Micropruina sp.]
MTTKTRLGVAAIAASLAFVLAACSGGSQSGTATSDTTTARSTGSPASISAAATATFNAADVAFAQMMIVHHQGAIQMADLAPSRAQNQDVLALAARIKAAQAPEIDQMTSWLTAWGAAPSMMSGSTTSGTGGMDHGGMGGATSAAGSSMSMPGMMSGDQMQQLESASGAAFDKMFLELMIVHHQGAIEMAETEIADGSNPEAVALAQKIKSDQTAEIAEIQALLQTL